ISARGPSVGHGACPARSAASSMGRKPSSSYLRIEGLGTLDKLLQHPSKGFEMSHLLYRIGNFSGRHPWRVIAAWALVALAVVMLNSSAGGQPDDNFRLPGSESQRAADLIQDRFPQQTLYTSNVIFHSPDGLTSPETKTVVQQAVHQL